MNYYSINEKAAGKPMSTVQLNKVPRDKMLGGSIKHLGGDMWLVPRHWVCRDSFKGRTIRNRGL